MNKKTKLKNKIRANMGLKSFILASSALVLTVLLISLISSQFFTGSSQFFTRSNVAVSPSSGEIGFPFMFDREMCEAGQDFILQVSPVGCVPSVVRSDLLEEQNVPVFCPIVATQLNPLIDVEAIKNMVFSFSGGRPPEVSGIGYYPARAALGRTGQVTQPILNNLGYAVIVLKQQRNESTIPDFVGGNLTARIRYDIKNAFGVGQAVFYLPEITDDEWNRDFKRYSFWDGRGYLRAESIGDDRASISIYSDRETHGLARTDKRKIASEILEVGEISREMFVPGFDYCLGSMQLELKSLENPDTTARLNINGDISELKEKEKFIDNKCRIKSIDKQGIVEKVTINCDDDYRSGTFPLTIRPRINLSIDGVVRDYSIGDRLLDGNGAYFLTSDGRKTVYLAYVKTDGDSMNEQNLSVTLIAIPGIDPDKIKLSETELNSIARFLNSFPTQDASTIFRLGENIWKAFASVIETSFRGITGENFKSVHFRDSEKNIFGKTVKVIGFAGSRDADLSQFGQEFENYYENAIEDYNTIIESYSGEKYPDTEQKTLGEQALYNKIELMLMTNQKRTVVELCKEFEDRYPNRILLEKCEEAHKLSNVEISSRDVVIDDKVYRITLDRIKEPTFDKYGANISVRDSVTGQTRTFQLRKNIIITLNETRNEFIQLLDLDEDVARLRVNLRPAGITGAVGQFLSLPTSTLRRDFPETFGSRYTFTLQGINLKKIAKVSVKPNIKYTQTEATFPFRIGIEKRAIQLSPEKTEERIESLNNTIEKWRSISDKLETAVRIGKTACLGVGTTLTIKNFFANLKGEGIARQKVMRGSGGWFDICEEEVLIGNYRNVDSCLLAKNPEIEASVEEYADIIEEQNERFNELQEGITKKRFLGEDVVDTEKLMIEYVNDDYRNELSLNLQDSGINKIRIGNEDIGVSDITKLIGPNTTFITQARSLELNARLLNSDDPVIRKIAESQIKADLGDIWINSREQVIQKTLREGLPSGLKNVGIGVYPDEKAVSAIYKGEKTTQQVGSIPANVPVEIIIFGSVEYVLQLEHVESGRYRPVEVYDINGNKIEGDLSNRIKSRFDFRFYDQNTYKNTYKNPEVRYYSAGQYKGLPAIVPFNINDGWYVATKPAIPILGGIQPYYDSGRASSFYLCNVGSNGREEFFSEIGDDICRGFVIGASQPPDFPGLSASESLNKRIRAEEALLEAQRRYRPGVDKISIFGQTIPVGSPTVGIPDIQCQDFMSPSDCNLLFNVCDPVVCPSSRCDLGGTYPVSDVVQSGIIGSLALCLPNFPEVKIPVCISGVHAGLEAYLSVLDSYQACLETSLETGQTIGICDEIHSVYMCDFFWRQSLPLVKYAIPQIIGSILGKNVRGGGEYLGFQDAWQRAGDSVGFFTQYYAANSFQAFKARSAEEIGAEVCKNWVSIIGPGDGRLFDALIEPDVPPQFYGRFDEIPFTTATIPPMSHYKVFYHIYAGKDLPAYYQVYLRGTGEAFYRDVPTRRMVASGFIKAEEYATETKDFTAPVGYNELCIVVNNKEECGFKQVTTEFGVNYMTEQYLREQASTTDITTEATCVSGTPSVLSLLTPNIQAGVEEGINPAIYNRGITRICATDNPGKATDPFIGTENERWADVGYCDTSRIKCWLDTESVKDTIRMTSIEDKVLEDVKSDYMDVLFEEGDYVRDFGILVKEIEAEENPIGKIELINEKYNKVYFMHEKGYLTFLRGNVYNELARGLYSKYLDSIQKEQIPPPTDEKYPFIDEETARKIAEIEEETKKIGTEIAYPIFEYKYGGVLGLGKTSIYYAYSGNNWYWALNRKLTESSWFPTDRSISDIWSVDPRTGRLINPYERLSEENQEFTIKFVGKSYSEGLKLLMERTIQNEGKGLLSNVELSAGEVKFSPKRRFTFKEYAPLTFYFEYDSSSKEWKWSDNEEQWFSVSEEIPHTAEMVLARETPSFRPLLDKFENLIELLEGKGFLEGATVIFGSGAQVFIQTNDITTPITPIAETCSTEEDCQQLLGEEIIEMAREKKAQYPEVDFSTVKEDTGAESFECLALQVAWTESRIRHCNQLIDSEGNPLYCNGEIDELISGDEFNSLGIMQINIDAHPNVDVADFEENVRYGINLLINNYNPSEKIYNCYRQIDGEFVSVFYSGWERALRTYNGWNSPPYCDTGNPNYVEHVLSDSNKNAIINLFLEVCGS